MEQLRSALGAHTPRLTIALTAYAGEQDRRRALAVGYKHHIPKPIDPLALAQMIGDMLSTA
jgi:CheY-like chemotaxis protein